MELVYLWVEKHKNIYKQGFNFSSKFECTFKPSYDDTGHLDNNCILLIKKSKENIGIFPNNINITAIVGENGAGKSALLEILSNKYSPVKYKNLFFIFFDSDKKLLQLCGAQKGHKGWIELSELEQEKENEFKISVVDNISLLDNTKTIYFSNLLNEYDLEVPRYYIGRNYSHLLNISTTHLLSQRKLIETKYEAINYNSITGFDKVYRSYRIQQIQMALISIKNGLDVPFNLPERIIIKNINFESLFDRIIENTKKISINRKLKKLLEIIRNSNSKKEIFRNYIKMNLVISFILENIKYENIEKLLDIALDIKEGTSLEFFYSNFKRVLNTDEDFNNNLISFKPEDKFKYFFKNADNLINEIEKFCIIDTNKYEVELNIEATDFKFLEIYEKLIQQSEYFWDISWRGLSSGEEAFLYQFSRFHFLKGDYKNDKNLNLKIDNKEIDNLVWLIDEGETSLHPQWQKQYINYLIEFFKKNFTQNIHIVLTSHSPFILSDIPKENVIFLEKDEKTGNCINSTDKMKYFNTFGANIHTLLSDGFFMKDGLMGEFAKDKINQVYNFIKDNDISFIKTKEEAQNIINLIGEPILKKELQFLYDKEFEIDDIDKQIREYEKAIEKLKSKKKKND